MADLRALVDTVVIVMMENRSFDHVLGHLSFDGLNADVRGLVKPLKQQAYENLFENEAFAPWRTKDRPLGFDPPHEHDAVAIQLARSPATGQYTMTGFVEAYVRAQRAADATAEIVPGPRVECMGFYAADQVPITSFLAQHFAVCDHWHASLPTSTQPNKTMAWTGATQIADTKLRLIPTDATVLDWLEGAGVRWRVYSDGLSFFVLYRQAWDHVSGPNFRPFETLLRDFAEEPDATFPQVIIVEPSYASAPHIGSDRPNDNHSPLPMGFGEEFVRDVYDAVTANPRRWAKTVMILTYDEHGGFYDHIAPPAIPYEVRDGAGTVIHRFETLGVRVPAVVVSPLAEDGKGISATFDHTSILQFLAELFTPNEPYSPTVDERRRSNIASVSEALTRDSPRNGIPRAPAGAIPAMASLATRTAPRDDMQQAFEAAALQLLADRRDPIARKYPDLIHWEVAVGRGRAPV